MFIDKAFRVPSAFRDVGPNILSEVHHLVLLLLFNLSSDPLYEMVLGCVY